MLSVLLYERVFDRSGTLLWEGECPFESLRTPGQGVMRQHVLYEVVSSDLDGPSVKTIVRRFSP